MQNPSGNCLLNVLREALSQTVWAIGSAILVSSLVGTIILAAAAKDIPGSLWETWGYLMAWAFHWAVSGAMLWGLPLAVIHIWGLHRLILGEEDPIESLLIMTANQAIVSTVCTVILIGGEKETYRAAGAGVALLVLVVACWRRIRRQKDETVSCV